MIKVRKGQAPPTLSRAEFGERFRAMFLDPAFRPERAAIERIESLARDGIAGDTLRSAGIDTDALDRDQAVQDEVRNVARSLVEAVGELRAGRLPAPGAALPAPRPK